MMLLFICQSIDLLFFVSFDLEARFSWILKIGLVRVERQYCVRKGVTRFKVVYAMVGNSIMLSGSSSE